MKPLLSLVMILKDEASSIQAVLEAALPHVDGGTILDTGSTDGTQELVRNAFRAAGKVLYLVEEDFIDYAASRNRVMTLDVEYGAPAAFQLMLSGDEYLSGGDALREHLGHYVDGPFDCFRLRVIVDGVSLMSPRVFRTGSPWKYEHKVHEVPYNRQDPTAQMGDILDAGIDHIVSDLESRCSTVWEKHIPLLQTELEASPFDERALMFLAQSYEYLMPGFDEEERKQYSAEAMNLRLRRDKIATGGKAERAFNQMHMIDDARLTGLFTNEQLLAWAKALHNADPKRPETAMMVATIAMDVEPVQKVYEYAAKAAKISEEARSIVNDSPVDTSIEWRAHNMAAVACKQLAAKHGGDWWRIMKEHAEAGMVLCEAMGGPKHVFFPFFAEAAAAESSDG